jgi:ligand-binding sensor domain-containing protein
MLNRILALVFLTLPLTARAGNWASYTNTDVVRQIVISGDHIWGATSGGVEALNINDGAFIKLTNTDGLGGINFNCAEVDTSNSLWFGGADGWLSKISASGAIKNYAFRDSTGLSGRAIVIFDLAADRDLLWIAGDIGVSKFSPYINDGEIRDNARQLGNISREEDAVCVKVIGDNVWAGTVQGIAFTNRNNPNIQNPASWRSFRQSENGLGNADIRSIIAYHDTVLAGTANGVFKLVVSPDTLWSSMGLTSNIIYKFYMAGTTLLAATNHGIFQYNGTAWTAYINNGLPGGLAKDLTLDSRGVLWAATPNSGLGELSDSLWVLHSIPGPASNIIGRLAIDSMGGIWMAHDGKGLSRFADGQWRIYNSSNSDPDGSGPLMGLESNDVICMSVAPDGSIWAGDYGHGLYQYDWNSWHHWTPSNCPMFGAGNDGSYWAVTAVLADPMGNIWVSSFGAIHLLLMGVFAPYSPDSTWQLFYADSIGLATNYATVFRSQNSTIWVGRGDGLDRLEHDGTPFNTSDDQWLTDITDLNVVDMSLDPSGILWLATASGLFFINPADDTVGNVELPAPISGSVNGVASDGVGNIWVGTVAGLGVLRPNRAEPQRSLWLDTLTTANSPILGNTVTSVAIDIPTGVVYIGTQNGLSVFDSGILPPKSDLADMSAYPNPAVISEGVKFVEFKRIPSTGTLSIYTASGDLVRKLDLSRESTWDLKNSKEERVAGGIYFFYVISGDASGTGKIAVIK